MYQQQSYMYQPQPQMTPYVNRPVYQNGAVQQMLNQGLRGRPVSSLEEARVSMIDFDGSIFYFPDVANKKIYTKQINLDGTATMHEYELKENILNTNEPLDTSNYITRAEFESALTQLKEALAAINKITAADPGTPTTIPLELNF